MNKFCYISLTLSALVLLCAMRRVWPAPWAFCARYEHCIHHREGDQETRTSRNWWPVCPKTHRTPVPGCVLCCNVLMDRLFHLPTCLVYTANKDCLKSCWILRSSCLFVAYLFHERSLILSYSCSFLSFLNLSCCFYFLFICFMLRILIFILNSSVNLN